MEKSLDSETSLQKRYNIQTVRNKHDEFTFCTIIFCAYYNYGEVHACIAKNNLSSFNYSVLVKVRS